MVRFLAARQRALLSCSIVLVACGGGGPHRSAPNIREKALPPEAPPPSTITRSREEAEVFKPTSGPGDVPTAYVRDERSSRLDVKLPRGKAREEWTQPLGGTAKKPCRGLCTAMQASFVLAAGNRVAVAGAEEWVLFDTRGRGVDRGKIEAPSGQVRMDRAAGTIVPDETRSVDLPADAKVAARNGLVVLVKNGGVFVGEKAIEGKFDAFDVAIDDLGYACVLVRQADDLMMWTVPVDNKGSIGRQKLPGVNARKRTLGPPVLGKNLRVVQLDTHAIALSLEGKKVWERRGVPTGGMTITADDHVLIANDGKVVAIDPRGKTTELWSSKEATFVTPPILNASGMLFVASGESLHAISFTGS